MAKLGLGTPATRAGIIETLLAREYIRIENTKVYPTPKGYLLWDLTKNKDLLIGKPEITAQWEQALSKIAKKQYTREEFLKNIYKYLDVTIQDLKNPILRVCILKKVRYKISMKLTDMLLKRRQKYLK